MTITRLAIFGLAAGLLWLLLQWSSSGLNNLPDMSPVMPEADGVHPVLAAMTFHSGYAFGEGVVQKYPPLGGFLMGVAVHLIDPGFYDEIKSLMDLPENERRLKQWNLRNRIAPLIEVSRWITRLVMAMAMGLLAMAAAQVSFRLGAKPNVALSCGLICIVTFGASYPVLYYGSTTNVDAYALAPSLAMLLFAMRRCWWAAAAAAGLAAAAKDPYYAPGLALVVFALFDKGQSRLKRLLTIGASGIVVYLICAGALTDPVLWLEHIKYLFKGGVDTVPRIDPTEIGQWGQLIAYGMRLVWESQGAVICITGIAGLGVLGLKNFRSAALLIGIIFGVWILFILPVRFVYLRFLLLPMAVISIGAAALLAYIVTRVMSKIKKPWVEVAVVLTIATAWWLVQHRDLMSDCPPPNPARYYVKQILGGAEPRIEAAEAVSKMALPGDSIVLIADQKRHGPPLDPVKFNVEEVGLYQAESCLAKWLKAQVNERPAWVLIMSFPVDNCTGGSSSKFALPEKGKRLGGIYKVREIFGEPSGHIVERAVVVRPMIALLQRCSE